MTAMKGFLARACLSCLLVPLAQAGQVTYTSGSGNWTAPANVTSVIVEVWGGGGGGGGNTTTSDGGGGGGGGAYSRSTLAVTPGNDYAYSVGAGGNGGNGANGTAGGDTYFIDAATVMAKGGAFGYGKTGGFAPGAGGLGGAAAAGFGDVKFSGGNGDNGRNNNRGRGGPGGSSAGTAANGTTTGGTQAWGTVIAAAPPAGGGIGGNGGLEGQNGNAPASGNGGGGGGSGDVTTGGARTGGNGANGKIIISWYAKVLSIDRADPDPTSAASVSWTVTFSESVTGVDATDFTLVEGGSVSGTSITSVSGGGTSWTVTASTGSGTGTLGLNLVDDNSIVDSAALPLGGTTAGDGDFTGQVYTIERVSALKSFNPEAIIENGSSVLTVTLTNPGGSDVTGVAFTDSYPAGLVNATPASGASTCGGTVTAADGGSSLALSGGTIPAAGSCTVTVNVTSATAGSYLNSTGTITTDSGNIAASTATLTVDPPPNPRFNACDVGTTCNNATPPSQIKTKIAGANFNLDIVALLFSGAIDTGYNRTISVQLMNASDNSGALDAYGCRSSWTLLGAAVAGNFNDGSPNGLTTVGPFNIADAYQEVRVRVTRTGGPFRRGCSSDAFAIRPNSLANISVSDLDWQTAYTGSGTPRTLYNTAASGGNVHKAGQPFTIVATALNAAAVTTSNYAGSPEASLTACLLPAAPCTLGTLNAGIAWTASLGTVTSTTASYSEAGSFTMKLVDTSFANIDLADSSTAERYIESAEFDVGRFVPDHFELSAASTPQFKTFNDDTCTTRSFTYIGQAFGYVTLPQAAISAKNAAGQTTVNYRDALWKLTSADLSQNYAYTLTPPSTPGLDTALVGTPSVSSNDDGTGTAAANSNDKLAFIRNATTPQSPFTAAITLEMDISDDSENAVSGNGIIDATAPLLFNGGGSGIAFDAGNAFRYGRLRIANAHGSELLDLPVSLQAQYWNGTLFVTNTDDHCTTLVPGNIALSSFTSNLAACETAVSISGAFSAGKSNLKMLKPGAGNSGSVNLTVNLGSAALGQTCTSVGGAPVPDTPANLSYLQGRWSGANYDQNPFGRATFGVYKNANEFIYLREMY